MGAMRLADVPVPTSSVCRQALEVVSRFSSPALVNHCLRSYLFAAARAQLESVEIDVELLYVASLLHDLGLEEPFNAHRMPFEEAGGSVAWVFAAGAGWPVERRDRAAAVIVAHMQGTDPIVDPEGDLLDIATGLDISGRGPERWPADFLAEAVAAYPRLDLGSRFTACIREQAERKPHSEAARVIAGGQVNAVHADHRNFVVDEVGLEVIVEVAFVLAEWAEEAFPDPVQRHVVVAGHDDLRRRQAVHVGRRLLELGLAGALRQVARGDETSGRIAASSAASGRAAPDRAAEMQVGNVDDRAHRGPRRRSGRAARTRERARADPEAQRRSSSPTSPSVEPAGRRFFGIRPRGSLAPSASKSPRRRRRPVSARSARPSSRQAARARGAT